MACQNEAILPALSASVNIYFKAIAYFITSIKSVINDDYDATVVKIDTF